MKYERESWWKLYRSEPTDQRAWPLFTRTLRDHLIRLPDQEDGTILRKTKDPVTDLGRVLGHVRDTEWDMVREAITTLLEDGFLVHEKGSGRLWIRNFQEAQNTRSKEAQRKAKQRERLKTGPQDSPGHGAGTSHGTSHGHVTHIEKRGEEKRREEEERVRETSSAPPSTGVRKKPKPETGPETNQASPPEPEPATPDQIRMQVGWEPSNSTLQNAQMGGIPEWAELKIRPRFIGHFANSDDACTEAEWNQRYSKWLFRDWNSPKLRPKREDDLGAEESKRDPYANAPRISSRMSEAEMIAFKEGRI